MRPFSPRLAFACLSLLAAMACRRGSIDTVAVPSGVPSVTDGEAVAIVLAANNTDLAYARLVPARSGNPDVAEFARRMTTDHTILNMRVNEIASLNRIEVRDNEISLEFRDNSANRRDELRAFAGARFDSAYAANEIRYHTELLGAIEKVLAPQVRNAELREFVNNLRPAVSAHLAHAERMRAGLATRK
jgi:putative membrane protein